MKGTVPFAIRNALGNIHENLSTHWSLISGVIANLLHFLPNFKLKSMELFGDTFVYHIIWFSQAFTIGLQPHINMPSMNIS